MCFKALDSDPSAQQWLHSNVVLYVFPTAHVTSILLTAERTVYSADSSNLSRAQSQVHCGSYIVMITAKVHMPQATSQYNKRGMPCCQSGTGTSLDLQPPSDQGGSQSLAGQVRYTLPMLSSKSLQ